MPRHSNTAAMTPAVAEAPQASLPAHISPVSGSHAIDVDHIHCQGLFHAWEAIDSSLLNVLMPGGFPIAPQWISPILTASLTPTECRSASGSAETAPARLHSWTAPQRPAYAG